MVRKLEARRIEKLSADVPQPEVVKNFFGPGGGFESLGDAIGWDREVVTDLFLKSARIRGWSPATIAAIHKGINESFRK